MVLKPKRPQLGKIKQWSAGLGAKLAGSANTIDLSLKQDLFAQIELRGIGTANLYAATEQYWSYLAKKKPLPFDASLLSSDDAASISSGVLSTKPDGKLLPIEAIGLAMSSYGSQFSDASTYASTLSSLGEAHLKLGSLQAVFARDTSNIFLSRIARSKTAIDSFHAAMKKLDAATAKLDAVQAKVQKSKKEKRELQEELRLASATYDEAVSDVEARAEAIHESELDDLDCLTTYVETHIDYLAQAQAVLEQARRSAPGSSIAGARRPVPAPLTRPRSASEARPTPPALPRRTSAREPIKLNLHRTASRKTTSSSISLTPSETRRVRESTGAATADDANAEDDGQSTAKKDKNSGRLRMPSFSAASGPVSSMTSGLSGTFTRSKSSIFFGAPSSSGNNNNNNNNGDSHSPDKEKADGGSKWSFMSRSRKESGFQDLDGDESLRASSRRHEPEQVHNKVSSNDVAFGFGEADSSYPLSHTTKSESMFPTAPRRLSASKRNSLADDSPFSPVLLGSGRFSPPLHERGESGLGMDANFLGETSHAGPHLDVNHTGLSAYSDGGDPFSGGGGGLLSPQGTGFSTGQFHTDDDTDDHDDETALTGGGRRRGDTIGGNSGGGWTKSLPFANGNKEYRGFNDDRGDVQQRQGQGNGSNFSMTPAPVGGSRPPPPPVPSSSAFLNMVKSKQKPPPVPPPLPTRHSGL